MVETAGRVDLTVLICTYNRARLLERALEHVAAQAVSPSVRWEVLVVDNNATDRTAEVVARFVEDPRLPALHYLREPHPGVAFARKRGLREARGELVAFVDDDCLLERDWIDHALQFAREHPRAGAFGGRNELLWEAPPPRVALLYGVSLAGQDFGGQACRMPSAGRVYPVGAGLVVRRDAVLGSGWVASGVLRGRDPAGLHAGEDSEVVLRLRQHGWEIWYTPLLHLRHVLPPHRTTLTALRRIHRGFGRAEVFLDSLARQAAPSFRNRLRGLVWATRELVRVLARFPKGYMRYVDERPTWLIRLSHARGCLEGAAYYLVTGRSW